MVMGSQFQFGLPLVCNGLSNLMSCDNDVSFIFVLHLQFSFKLQPFDWSIQIKIQFLSPFLTAFLLRIIRCHQHTNSEAPRISASWAVISIQPASIGQVGLEKRKQRRGNREWLKYGKCLQDYQITSLIDGNLET